MKKRYKLLTMALISVMALTGCQAKGNTSKSGDKNTLVIGFDDTFVPMGFKDKDGKVVGFDIDLSKEVTKRLNMSVQYQPIDWSLKEKELDSKHIDAIWNGYSATPERAEKVLFSDPYLDNRQVIVVKEDSYIKTKKDLKDKNVGVQSGSSSLEAVNKDKDVVKSLNQSKPVLYQTNDQALMDLSTSRLDAVVCDEILAKYFMNQNKDAKLKILDENYGKEQSVVGFRKEDKELRDKINNMLNELKKDKTYDKIYEKWFGEYKN